MFFDKYEKLCKAQGKSPTGIATELGIGRATVTYWRAGNTPKQEILTKIANYFNVSIDYLLDNEKSSLSEEDKELNEYLEFLKYRPEGKMLFSVAKGCTKEEIEQAVKIIDALRKNDD